MSLSSWPALALAGRELPRQIDHERGVWGKVQGADSDFRWIALSGLFAMQAEGLERDLTLGSEDEPRRFQLWYCRNGVYYAATCYPSRATDAAGRSGLLEKQVLEWRHAEALPAALGALLLLPHAASLDDRVWWESRGKADWAEDDFHLTLDKAGHAPLAVSEEALEQASERGIAGLFERVTEEALSELYARLLAGQRAVPLDGLDVPLSAEALAVLLLPLPRDTADRLSMAGWLPSRRADAQSLRPRWDMILGGNVSGLAPSTPAPSVAQRQQGARLARALAQRDPAALQGIAITPTPEVRTDSSIQLAMWGPPQAGKTVLLAQLYLEAVAESGGEWDIFVTKGSLDFIDSMEEKRHANLFPPATTVGTKDQISYRFRNRRTDTTASLVLEDRAGQDFVKFEVEAQERLNSADGLILLFDPLRGKAELEREILLLSQTLRRIYLARGHEYQKDDRPIAVCVSKADILIESPGDYRRACEDPHEFVRERDKWGLTQRLDRYCDNYRLFPVSAVGVQVYYGVIETVAFYDEKLTQRLRASGRSFNLMAPFAWLIDQVEGRA